MEHLWHTLANAVQFVVRKTVCSLFKGALANFYSKEGEPTVPIPFGPWTEWTECSRSCGEGKQARVRECVIPPGSDIVECTGLLREVQGCNTNPCPGEFLWYTCNHWSPHHMRSFQWIVSGNGENMKHVLELAIEAQRVDTQWSHSMHSMEENLVHQMFEIMSLKQWIVTMIPAQVT